MDDSPGWSRLPDGLQSTGDPVEGNPFPENTQQHQVWSEATRRAEEDLCRLNSQALRGTPQCTAGPYASWVIELIVGKFDIWAKRGVHVVWSDSVARAYDEWLFNYAQVWLESATRTSSPILVDVESLVNELRLRLMERMEYWKAEGHRYSAEQDAHQKAHMKEVDAGWLRIDSKRLEGAKLTDCLRDAYDHHARLLAKSGEPLTEESLNQNIPSLVFIGAIHYKWIPYPLIRRAGRRVVGSFLDGWYDRSRAKYELVPKGELTETFGGYKVTKGYEDQFKRIVGGRIAHWRAEALTGPPVTGPQEYGRFSQSRPSRIYPEDIDSFAKVKTVLPSDVAEFLRNGYLDLSEDAVQCAFEEIIGVPFHKKDWGGETNDLYTSNVLYRAGRIATAFFLKGNGLRKPTMNIADCGKNGDQLVRLFDSPADLFIVQFVGEIAENVIRDVEGKVENMRRRGKNAFFCVMTGQDTARVMCAYGKLERNQSPK